MSERTNIEWAHHTFNPWLGCTKIDPACEHCYAETWAKYTGHPELWQGERRRTTAINWQQPIKWDRAAAAAGVRERAFPSLCDPFDNQVPKRWRDDFWHLIEQTPHLDWLLLTKRPGNIAKMLPNPATGVKPWGDGWPNVWLGISAGTQEDADRNLPILLATAAKIHFVSLEPLLEQIDLRQWLHSYGCGCGWGGDNPLDYCNDCGWRGEALLLNGPSGDHVGDCPECKQPLSDYNACPECDGHDGDGMSFGPNHLPKLDLVIGGGETGPRARPMHPAWLRSLRDQCVTTKTSFFFKRWGAWAPVCALDDDAIDRLYHPAPEKNPDATRVCKVASHVLHADGSEHDIVEPMAFAAGRDAMTMFRIGTRAIDSKLDGRAWHQMPETAQRSKRQSEAIWCQISPVETPRRT